MKVVYIMPTNGGDMSKLLGVFGPFGPRVDRVVVCKLVFTLILYILCQQLERVLYFIGLPLILYMSCL